MSRSIADMSWDELAAVAHEAGAAAANDTVKAGISTFGVVDGKAFQVTPDGQIHDLGPIEQVGDALAEEAKRQKKPVERSRTGHRTGKHSTRTPI